MQSEELEKLSPLADLDACICAVTGAFHVMAPSASHSAIMAHIARRARQFGKRPLVVRTRPGMPLWSEVGLRLGMTKLPSLVQEAARALASTLGKEKAMVVCVLPEKKSFEEKMALELMTQASAQIFFLSPHETDFPVEKKLHLEETLSAEDKIRWLSAVLHDDSELGRQDALDALELWWIKAKSVSREQGALVLSAHARECLGLVGLLGRVFARSLFSSERQLGLQNLFEHAVLVEYDGLLQCRSYWQKECDQCAEEASPSLKEEALQMLKSLGDIWSKIRSSEILLSLKAQEKSVQAYELFAEAFREAFDPQVRGVLCEKWLKALGNCDPSEVYALKIQTSDLLLSYGEFAQALRFTQVKNANQDPVAGLRMGAALMGMNDLTAASVIFERVIVQTRDAALLGSAYAELSEIAFLRGEFATSKDFIEKSLKLNASVRVVLKTRNTLGKILLAESKWEDADRHFTEDEMTAECAFFHAEKLRARLNRGVALFSKGQLAEAEIVFRKVFEEGESRNEVRACAFALDNLSVIALMKHAYGDALLCSEKSLLFRRFFQDRMATARTLLNLAEMSERLGLLQEATDALVAAQVNLAQGMTPGISSRQHLVASKIAFAKGDTDLARREIALAVVDSEHSSDQKFIADAHFLSARIALEDGDVLKAAEALKRAKPYVNQEVSRAEYGVLLGQLSRAKGESELDTMKEVMRTARQAGDEEILREAYVLYAKMCLDEPDRTIREEARTYLLKAQTLRDEVVRSLSPEKKSKYFSKKEVLELTRLLVQVEHEREDVYVPAVSKNSEQTSSGESTEKRKNSRTLLGSDPRMIQLKAAIHKVANSTASVLIYGESGTGKELVAEALHFQSDRAKGPFVTVNCAALVENLLLSELFGHEKGAFTGATSRKRGRFEVAQGGTLFLDEIGDISFGTQVALLRVLQEKKIERVGSHQPISVDVRVVCATHKDLKAMVSRGEFREDLYYRLCAITLETPPLRFRAGDLDVLASALLEKIAAERGEKPKVLGVETLALLAKYSWPGNIRELENVLRALSLFAEGSSLEVSDLVAHVDSFRELALKPSTGGSARSFFESSDPELHRSFQDSFRDISASRADEMLDAERGVPNVTELVYGEIKAGKLTLLDIRKHLERDCIERALLESSGNITKAAHLLGMKRPRLSQLVKQYALLPESEVDE